MRWAAKLCALVMAAAGLHSAAQTGAISWQAIDQYGQPLPHAQVRVCSATSSGTPCNPTVPIYLDYNLTTPVSNPYTADAYGNFSFYVPALAFPNVYLIQLSPANGITWSYLFDGPGGTGASGCIPGGLNGTLLASNGSGGCSSAFVQVNSANLTSPIAPNFVDSATVAVSNPGTNQVSFAVVPGTNLALSTNSTPNTSQSILNFTDTATIHFTNPSGGVESATCVTSTISLIGCLKPDGTTISISGGTITAVTATSSTLGIVEPDNTTVTISGGVLSAASALIIQAEDVTLGGKFAAGSGQTLDFNSTLPAPPGGNLNVTFQNDPATGRLSAYVPSTATPAIQPVIIPPISGQYVILYPSTVTVCSNAEPGRGTIACTATGTVNNGLWMVMKQFPSSFPPQDLIGTFGGFALPSYVNPANVTAVYGFSYNQMDNPSAPGLLAGTCGAATVIPSGPTSWSGRQTIAATGLVGSTIPSATCHFEWSDSGSNPLGDGIFIASSMGLIAYYNGIAPPLNTNLNLAWPFALNFADNTLGLDPLFPYWVNALHVSDLGVAANTGPFTVTPVRDGANATDCSTGGGSTFVECTTTDGVTYTALGSGGGSGITALTGDGTATGPGSAALTLATVNSNVGTCGDSTHVGQVTLNAKGLTTACTPIAISGGGGSGTVNSGTANQLAYYASTGTAVSGTNAIPNGTTATTQTAGDSTTKVATDAFVLANAGGGNYVYLSNASDVGAQITAAATTMCAANGGVIVLPNSTSIPWTTTGTIGCYGVSLIGYGQNASIAPAASVAGDILAFTPTFTNSSDPLLNGTVFAGFQIDGTGASNQVVFHGRDVMGTSMHDIRLNGTSGTPASACYEFENVSHWTQGNYLYNVYAGTFCTAPYLFAQDSGDTFASFGANNFDLRASPIGVYAVQFAGTGSGALYNGILHLSADIGGTNGGEISFANSWTASNQTIQIDTEQNTGSGGTIFNIGASANIHLQGYVNNGGAASSAPNFCAGSCTTANFVFNGTINNNTNGTTTQFVNTGTTAANAPLTASSTTDSSFTTAANFLNSSLTSGHRVCTNLGVNTSANYNAAGPCFKYGGSGSSTSEIGFYFNNITTPNFYLNGAGKVATANNTLDDGSGGASFAGNISANGSPVCTTANGACPTSGSGPTTQTVYSSSGRAIGTIYHNTGSTPIFVTFGGTGTAGSYYEALSDSSSTPTTIVGAAVLTVTGDPIPMTFIVLPGNYYEIQQFAGTIAINVWVEWH